MQKEKLINHLQTQGKGNLSWFEIGTMYGVEGTTKQVSDYVRKLAKRKIENITVNQPLVKKSNPLFEEFRDFVKSKYSIPNLPKPFKGDPNNIMVIGDTHLPFEHPEALDFCIHIQKKYNCGKIIHIGDIADFNSTTFHTQIPDTMSPGYEFEITKAKIQNWARVFPEVTVTLGNHDKRVMRKMNDAQISKHWQKSLSEIFEIDWNFVPDYIYNDIYFVHGEGATASLTALNQQMSTVQGHRHSETYITFPGKTLFAIQVPTLIDRNSLAFDYAKADPKTHTIGVTVILDNKTPIIERL